MAEPQYECQSQFDAWMQTVDQALVTLTGGQVTCTRDLPDWCYWDAYDADMTAVNAARGAMEDAGYF